LQPRVVTGRYFSEVFLDVVAELLVAGGVGFGQFVGVEDAFDHTGQQFGYRIHPKPSNSPF
jgi:hypothetical protein